MFDVDLADASSGRHWGPFINYVRVPRERGVRKISTYSYFGEGVKLILTQYFPSRYFKAEIARSSGLAGIIFHLRLDALG